MSETVENQKLVSLARWELGFDKVLGFLAALVLMLLMIITFIDVLGRYLFSAPLPGAFELTEIMMAMLIFAGLPLVSRTNQHVTVNLIVGILSPIILHFQRLITQAIMAVVLAVMAWRMWIKAEEMLEQGDETAYLLLPIAPVAFFMTLMMAVSTLIVAIQFIRNFRSKETL
ncbi:MAG: TRAP transporter small permease [SAR324 cluster bacterium]|nr:TRAP transporter small permease [SAR324 cluster bacterium]MEC8940191.1 TRAP transporter small permease [SAR324 cluster bacterium]MEC8981360.1 TRAP transporter small permease [SAR324 cluster bacterium]